MLRDSSVLGMLVRRTCLRRYGLRSTVKKHLIGEVCLTFHCIAYFPLCGKQILNLESSLLLCLYEACLLSSLALTT